MNMMNKAILLRKLQSGIEGGNIKDTFYLYVSSLILISLISGVIGFFVAFDNLLTFAIIITFIIVIAEYVVYYLTAKKKDTTFIEDLIFDRPKVQYISEILTEHHPASWDVNKDIQKNWGQPLVAAAYAIFESSTSVSTLGIGTLKSIYKMDDTPNPYVANEIDHFNSINSRIIMKNKYHESDNSIY